MMSLQAMQKAAFANKQAHGFNTTDVKFEMLLMYGEVNELFKGWLKDDDDNIGEELADIQIYLLGLAEILGHDLAAETEKKLAINAQRVYRDGQKQD